MAALKRAGFTLVVFAMPLFAVWMLVGCSAPKIEYRSIPEYLVPPEPKYESVKSDEVMCLTDSVYERLARNFLSCKQYSEELRSLLGVTK